MDRSKRNLIGMLVLFAVLYAAIYVMATYSESFAKNMGTEVALVTIALVMYLGGRKARRAQPKTMEKRE